MGDHGDEELESALQHQWAVVWNISEDEQGVDPSNDVTPAGKVSDDALK